MKKHLIIAGICLLSIQACGQKSTEEEKEAIKEVINTAYVEGLQNEGDFKKIDSGIHSGFNLLGIGESKEMTKRSIDEWKIRVQKQKENGHYPRKGNDKVHVKFKSIDITGTAAVVKLEYYVGRKKAYMDYISLYKFEDDWMMVNKIFYKFP